MNLLFLSRWLPYPANNGSRLRIYNLLKRLLKEGHRVHLITFYEQGDDLDLARQNATEFCTEMDAVLYKPFQPGSLRSRLAFFSLKPRWAVTTYRPKMAELVEAGLTTHKIDVLIANAIDMACYGAVAGKYGIPALLEELELGKLFEQYSLAPTPKQHLRNGLTWLKMAGYVRRLARHYQAVTVVSEKELELVGRLVDRNKITVLPNGADLTTCSYQPYRATDRAKQIIFNGALSFNLNYEAMHFFLNRIFPLLRQQEPDLELLITGKCDNLDRLKLVEGQPARLEGVRFTGYVEDIRPLITSSQVCIVPLLQGGGTRLKILEAFALGTPVVATTKGAEGLAAQPDRHLLIADDPAEFARAVLWVINEPELAANLTANARLLTQTHYDWDRVGLKLNALLDELRPRLPVSGLVQAAGRRVTGKEGRRQQSQDCQGDFK
jgi:glycosyltransferase involved in cell wall biosynthesis